MSCKTCSGRVSFLKAGREVGASKAIVLGGVKLVEYHGYEAFHQRIHTPYSDDFKLEMVEYMQAIYD